MQLRDGIKKGAAAGCLYRVLPAEQGLFHEWCMLGETFLKARAKCDVSDNAVTGGVIFFRQLPCCMWIPTAQ